MSGSEATYALPPASSNFLSFVLQFLEYGYQVYAIRFLRVHFRQDPVERLVANFIKRLRVRLDLFQAFRETILRTEHDAAQYPLLGFGRMGLGAFTFLSLGGFGNLLARFKSGWLLILLDGS